MTTSGLVQQDPSFVSYQVGANSNQTVTMSFGDFKTDSAVLGFMANISITGILRPNLMLIQRYPV